MKNKFFQAGLLTSFLISLLFSACSKSDNGYGNGNNNNNNNGGQNNANAVSIQNSSFSPSTLTVASGVTVTWTNTDYAQHTVTADDNSFTSSALSQGEKFSHKFTTAGTVMYHCNFHPTMTASIKVQ